MVSPIIEMVNILLKQYSVVTGADNTQAFGVRKQYDGSFVTNDVRQVIYIKQETKGTEDASMENTRFYLYPGEVSTFDDHRFRSRSQVVWEPAVQVAVNTKQSQFMKAFVMGNGIKCLTEVQLNTMYFFTSVKWGA